MSRLKKVTAQGQSIWLDYIRRDLLASGGLQALIDADGISGLTSNPAIFEKAIGGSADYDAALAVLVAQGLTEPAALFEALAIEDIRKAADLLRPVYDATQAADGYVSLEVSPRLAADAERTVSEGRRLWTEVGRPNLMIKVPGTPQGVSAIRQLISEGINVNVTLLFSRAAYLAVAEAYLAGLEALQQADGRLADVASVASFFISRIDAALDPEIAARVQRAADPVEQQALQALTGQIAIANAKLAYEDYKALYASPRWQSLEKFGARPQKLLWASTGTKNPQYRDTRYVEELIGPQTVNTVPPATMDAFRDHGEARASLEQDVSGAHAVISAAGRLALPLDAVTERLVAEGVQLFVDADDKLLAAVAAKRDALKAGPSRPGA